MKFKMGRHQDHFFGPPGVYYQPDTDRLWWIETGEMAFIWNKKGNFVSTYNRYHVWTEGIKGDLLVITGKANFVLLEEFKN